MKPWEVLGLMLGALSMLVFVAGLIWVCQTEQDARDCGVQRGSDREQ